MWIGERVIGDEQDTVAGEIGNELLSVGLGLVGIDFKFLADALAHDFTERRAAVGSLPDGGCDLVQREEGGIGRVITIISPASMRAAIEELRAM